jgi:hypothetical protein
MSLDSGRDRPDPKTCQDCTGIGRAWIEGMLQDCPECGGSGWESAFGMPSRTWFAAAFPGSAESRLPWEVRP